MRRRRHNDAMECRDCGPVATVEFPRTQVMDLGGYGQVNPLWFPEASQASPLALPEAGGGRRDPKARTLPGIPRGSGA
jgi:hypothetical protein